MASVIEGNCGPPADHPPQRPCRAPAQEPTPKVREIALTQHQCLKPSTCKPRTRTMAITARNQRCNYAFKPAVEQAHRVNRGAKRSGGLTRR